MGTEVNRGLSDTVIVSFDSASGDHPVLIVGRKLPGGPLEIINAFQDDVAKNLYMALTTPQGKEPS